MEFSTSTVWTTRALSLRALLTSSTEAVLTATSTKNPAASSTIWMIARRRAASGIAAVMDKWNSTGPLARNFPDHHKRRPGRLVPGPRELLALAGRRLAGKILLEPMDVVITVDDAGL